MKNEIDLSDWIFEQKPLYGIRLGDSLKEALEKLKNQNYFLSGGTNEIGYYYLNNGYRIGFSDNKIDEIGIDFLQSNSNIILQKDGQKYILNDKKVHEVLDLFNDLLIKWKPVVTNDSLSLMYLLEESGIYLIFDVYEGTLNKLGKSILMDNNS